ncbi:MAG: ABC transporter permease [Gemmataceae bacterium]|nr:ABC transporter permease [Gemmataceae bacterium]
MLATLTLIRREFSAYFFSPIGYAVLFLFLIVMGCLFYLSVDELTAEDPYGISTSMEILVNNIAFWLIFAIIPPLLTMRLFAEERATGTIEMLLTAPLHDWQVVISKYLACYAFFLVMWLPTLLYLPVLLDWQVGTLKVGIDPGPVWTTYIGVALAGAMFLSIGMCVSSFVKSQMVAALISLVLGLVFLIFAFAEPLVASSGIGRQGVFFVSVPLHFARNFSRGLIDSRQLILYCSVTLFCIFLTIRSLESRRWR